MTQEWEWIRIPKSECQYAGARCGWHTNDDGCTHPAHNTFSVGCSTPPQIYVNLEGRLKLLAARLKS